MIQSADKCNPDRESCQTESMLERALNAPSRFSRRRFLGTSGAASLGFLLALQLRGVYAGDPDASIGSGNYNSRFKVFKKFRLKCTAAPVSKTASVAWTETAAANGPPLSAHCTISAKGPSILSISSSALKKVEAVLTSTLYTPLAGQGNPTASSQAKLGISKDPAPPATDNENDFYDPYNGEWIGEHDKAPRLYFKTEGNGLPQGTPKVEFVVKGQKAQFTLAANTDKVGTHHEWNVHAKGSLPAKGKLEKSKETQKATGENGQASWNSTGDFSSSIGGSGTVEWSVEIQEATKWVKYDAYGKAIAHKLYDFEYGGEVPTKGKDVEGWIDKP